LTMRQVQRVSFTITYLTLTAISVVVKMVDVSL
jgi:hypothetical protein